MSKSSKKIVNVGTNSTQSEPASFKPTEDSKKRALFLRIIAIVLWLFGIGCGIGAYFQLQNNPVDTAWLIGFIVADLIFIVIGSQLWKKANRLDPASEKDKFRFFVQNQLGVIISIIAFLPLVVLILTNKNLDKKQKTIAGTVAVIALLIASVTGIDFNPASIEQYTEQIEEVKSLNNGADFVYWTKSGKSYHLYQDCSYINSDRTTEIFEGGVAEARELKNITDLCDRCANRAKKENSITTESSQ